MPYLKINQKDRGDIYQYTLPDTNDVKHVIKLVD